MARNQWLAYCLKRIRLADHSGGTAADSHGLSFYPRLQVGVTEGTQIFKERRTIASYHRTSSSVKLKNGRFVNGGDASG